MPISRKEIRVLYVEDDEAIYERWAAWFRATYSERSDHVRSKHEAVALVMEQRQAYNVAVVDLSILQFSEATTSSDKHGLELIDLIGDGVPCVMCSGSITPEIRRRAQKARGYLEKPFRERQVMEVIEKVAKPVSRRARPQESLEDEWS